MLLGILLGDHPRVSIREAIRLKVGHVIPILKPFRHRCLNFGRVSFEFLVKNRGKVGPIETNGGNIGVAIL